MNDGMSENIIKGEKSQKGCEDRNMLRHREKEGPGLFALVLVSPAVL